MRGGTLVKVLSHPQELVDHRCFQNLHLHRSGEFLAQAEKWRQHCFDTRSRKRWAKRRWRDVPVR